MWLPRSPVAELCQRDGEHHVEDCEWRPAQRGSTSGRAVAEEKDRLFKLRFQLATGQLENSARIGQTKKDIARLNTELRAREIAAAEAAIGSEAS